MPYPDIEEPSPEIVFGLAKILSGASPEFQAAAAHNHMNQARRLLQSEWFSTLLLDTRTQALREGWREGYVAADNGRDMETNPYPPFTRRTMTTKWPQ